MSSKETETVAISDVMPKNIWVLYLTRAQGKEVKDKLLNEDNNSAIRLANNGKRSSGKMTKHIEIRYLFVTDNIKQGEVTIIHCPMKEIIADYFTNTLQGSLFWFLEI